MFENRSIRERIAIYVFIALIVTILLSIIHYFVQGWLLLAVIIGAIIEFFCIFYILYLPLKIKK
jgi:hypothetical protein